MGGWFPAWTLTTTLRETAFVPSPTETAKIYSPGATSPVADVVAEPGAVNITFASGGWLVTDHAYDIGSRSASVAEAERLIVEGAERPDPGKVRKSGVALKSVTVGG
jgi:hypothetical protein